MKVVRLSAPLAVLPCVLAAAFPASAQTTLKETVVTATRTEIDSELAPAAVTIVTRQDIDQRHVNRISDALTSVPSLYLGGAGNGLVASPGFTGNFSLRGMDASRTLVLIDGVQPLQNAQSKRVNWMTVPVDDIERVEVASGAFSSLYGSNAIGGVVNLITKRPSKREMTARLSAGFDGASGERASVYFRDKFENGLGVAIGVSRARYDGFPGEFVVLSGSKLTNSPAGTPVQGVVRTTDKTGGSAYLVGDKGRQPWEQQDSSIRLTYDLHGGNYLYAGLASSDAELGYRRFNSYLTNASTGAEAYSGSFQYGGKRFSLTEKDFLGNAPILDSSRRAFGGYEGRHRDGKLKVDVAFIERKSSFVTSNTGAQWDGGAGKLTQAPEKAVDFQASYGVALGAAHYLVTGVSLHRDAVTRSVYNLGNWRQASSAAAIASESYDGNSSMTSLFLQEEYAATDVLTLYLGGRLDRWSTEGDFVSSTIPAQTYPRRSVTTFNPKLAANWRIHESFTLRSSVGSAFRAPTLFEMYANSVSSGVTTNGDPSLKPERGVTWDLGGDWRLASGVNMSASVYETLLDDMIYTKQISPTLKQRTNAGRTRVTGIELGAKVALTPWLDWQGHTSWIESKMLSNDGDAASVGKRLTDVPNRLTQMALTLHRGPWTGSVEARYTGKVFSSSDNSDTAKGVFGAYDAHTMVNTKLGYQLNTKAQVSLSVLNLLDVKAYQYALLPPRGFVAELKVSL